MTCRGQRSPEAVRNDFKLEVEEWIEYNMENEGLTEDAKSGTFQPPIKPLRNHLLRRIQSRGNITNDVAFESAIAAKGNVKSDGKSDQQTAYGREYARTVRIKSSMDETNVAEGENHDEDENEGDEESAASDGDGTLEVTRHVITIPDDDDDEEDETTPVPEDKDDDDDGRGGRTPSIRFDSAGYIVDDSQPKPAPNFDILRKRKSDVIDDGEYAPRRRPRRSPSWNDDATPREHMTPEYDTDDSQNRDPYGGSTTEESDDDDEDQ
ncbi:MAG: hypothetical protein M1831_001034 [Alyxoria varia]|nr:MAG: hypothetical protein M1831_001034 [Alyxoria varia]